jgi:hypothetical protein
VTAVSLTEYRVVTKNSKMSEIVGAYYSFPACNPVSVSSVFYADFDVTGS